MDNININDNGSKVLFYDTNALLELGPHAFEEFFVISQKTLEELEDIKTSSRKDTEIKYKARNIARLFDKNDNYYVCKCDNGVYSTLEQFHLKDSNDNIILACAKQYNDNVHELLVVTNDLNCKFISKEIFGLDTKSVNDINLVKNINEYVGYKDVTLSDEEMSEFYLHINENRFGCLLNEYLIIRKSDGEIVDYRRWNGEEYKALSYKQINSKFLGKIKPRNPQQVLAFDMLQNKDTTIKVISGKFGTGKDLLQISNAIRLIEEGKYEKLIYVRDAVIVKDSTDIGALPGTDLDKMKPFAMILADHLGGETGLEMQIMAGNIEIMHLGHIRGRDFKNSIIYCSEAENLTKEHVQLLIGRVGEGSALWMNGDFKQVDTPLLRMNNGFMTAINKLAGHKNFGYVQLKKTERSETAAMADLLD